MPLSSQLGPEDGWMRYSTSDKSDSVIHFYFKNKRLCDSKERGPGVNHDNVRADQCQKCFERTRNLYNSNDIKDAYRDIQ